MRVAELENNELDDEFKWWRLPNIYENIVPIHIHGSSKICWYCSSEVMDNVLPNARWTKDMARGPSPVTNLYLYG